MVLVLPADQDSWDRKGFHCHAPIKLFTRAWFLHLSYLQVPAPKASWPLNHQMLQTYIQQIVICGVEELVLLAQSNAHHAVRRWEWVEGGGLDWLEALGNMHPCLLWPQEHISLACRASFRKSWSFSARIGTHILHPQQCPEVQTFSLIWAQGKERTD